MPDSGEVRHERCRNCPHARHLHHSDGRCAASTVTGPPSTKGRAVGEGYEHTGRYFTPCGCADYTSDLNGVQR